MKNQTRSYQNKGCEYDKRGSANPNHLVRPTHTHRGQDIGIGDNKWRTRWGRQVEFAGQKFCELKCSMEDWDVPSHPLITGLGEEKEVTSSNNLLS